MPSFIDNSINNDEAAKVESTKSAFGGQVVTCTHRSKVLNCDMTFTMYWPPLVANRESSKNETGAAVLFYLSGLTCNHQNFITKGCAIEHAAKHNICLVCPDTSPRGDDVPDAPEEDECRWDFGKGAGFYVDATQNPYDKHYKMYSYVTKELPRVVTATNNTNRMLVRSPTFEGVSGVFGHSMGGHGALVLALKNPGRFSSASAFAPICNPSSGKCPWGTKCFTRYLGSVEKGKEYDATELAKMYGGPQIDILVHQGGKDNFYKTQLETSSFESATKMNKRIFATVNVEAEYDHSYYFVSTFMKDHVEFHARHLKDLPKVLRLSTPMPTKDDN